jgi:dolichol-phosphate mannosyltransferase
MLLSVVFSFRNEEENILELVRRVSSAVSGIEDLSYEMIFVNDDSTDRSLELLLQLQRDFPITIINMARRFGVTPCVLAGFARARGDAVVYMDADLQDPPELIPQMVEWFRDGAEVVHTTRTAREGESTFKMWVTRKAYRIIHYCADIDLPENTGDFKLLSKKVIKIILDLSEYDPYLRGLTVWVGHRQEFVYYQRQPRFKGKTKFPLFGKGPAQEFIRGLTSFSAAPLYFSLFIGFATVALSLSLLVYAFVIKFAGSSASETPSLFIAVAFLSGVGLITNGLIGIYVAKIFDALKGRPRYVIKDVIDPANGEGPA